MKCQREECDAALHDEDSMICSSCLKSYHFFCAGQSERIFKKMSTDNKNKWKCNLCKSKLTTTKSPVTKKLDADSSMKIDLSEIKAELKKLGSDITEIKNLKSEIMELKTKLSQLESGANFCACKVDDFNAKLASLEVQITKIDQIEANVSKNSHEIHLVKEQEEIKSRLKNIEVRGIPAEQGENIYKIVDFLSSYAGITLHPQDVDYAYRVQPKKTEARAAERSDGNSRSPPIVVCMTTRRCRDELLDAVKMKCRTDPLTTAAFRTSLPIHNVYVNEHMSHNNKIILYNAKLAAKQAKWRFVWTKNGKIRARKTDTSAIVNITNLSDVAQIK